MGEPARSPGPLGDLAPPRWHERNLAVAGALLLLVLLTFGGSLRNEFVFDDHRIVERNPVLRTLDPGTHLAARFWERDREALQSYEYYRPAVSYSLALEWAVFGDRPWGYHLTNLLLHAANAWLVFLLLGQVGARRPAAALGAALFAVHPVQSEVVALVVGRTDLLSVLFLLLAAWLHARLPSRLTKADLPRVAAVLAAYGAALLSKESAVTFPAIALAIEMARARCERWRDLFLDRRWRFWKLGAAYAGVIAVYLLLRLAVVGHLLGDLDEVEEAWRNPLVGASPFARWLTALVIASRYVVLLGWPRTLTVEYGFDVVPLVRSVTEPAFLAALATVAVACAVAYALARRARPALFGAVAATGTYLLVSHLAFPGPVVMAERFLYPTMVGIAGLVAGAGEIAAARFASAPGRARTLGAVAVLLLLALGVRSHVRVRDYRDDLTVFRAAVEARARSALAWNNLGSQQLRRREAAEALASFERALAIHPPYPQARLNRSSALRELGRLDEAERVLRALAEDDPETAAVQMSLISLLELRADGLAANGRTAEAARLREEVAGLARERAARAAEEGAFDAQATLLAAAGRNLASLGRLEDAAAAFDEALAAADREVAAGAAVPEASFGVQADVLRSSATFLTATNRPLEGARRFQQAAVAAERAERPVLAAELELDAGAAFLHAGRPDAALDAFRRAENLAGDAAEVGDRARERIAQVRSGSPAGAATPTGSPSALLVGAAEAALREGRAADAVPLYDQVLEAEPGLARALHGRARARMALGEWDAAEQDLQAIVADEPSGRQAAAVWTDLSVIASQGGDDAEALRRLDRAIEADGEFAEARLRRGFLRLEVGGQAAGAEADLTAALAAGLPPQLAGEAWIRLARLANERGDVATARERLERCLAVQPGHPRATQLLEQLR